MNSTSIPNDDDYNTSTNATPTPRIQIAVRRNQQAGSEDEGDDEEEFEMPMVETSPHSTGSPTISTLSASTSSSPMHTSPPDTPSMTKPSLSAPSFWSALRNQALDFAINVECKKMASMPCHCISVKTSLLLTIVPIILYLPSSHLPFRYFIVSQSFRKLHLGRFQ